MELSVVIVNYNTPKLTNDCINSIRKNTELEDYEIIVVDNSDKEENRFVLSDNKDNRIKLIDGVENKGFGSACNIGVKHCKGEYILLINSDMLVHHGTIDKSLNFIKEDADIGILGVKVVLRNGSFEHGCKRGFPTPSASFFYFTKLDETFPKNKKIGKYQMTYVGEDELSEVDAVSGSFMLIRRELYEKVGGFCEEFFMYGEDLDFCLRVKQQNKKVIYYPKVYATHLRGQSGLSNKDPKIMYHFYDAMKIFYRRHYEDKHSKIFNKLIYKAIDAKYEKAVKKG